MGITYTPCLKKKFKNDKEGIINIRITKNRNSKYISLKQKVKVSEWDKKRCLVKEKHNEAEYINSLIFKEISKLKKPVKTEQRIIKLDKKKTKQSVLSFIESEIDYKRNLNQIGTSKRYKSVLNHLLSYLDQREKVDLQFIEIDALFIREFQAYLSVEGLHHNSIINYLRTLRRLYIAAFELEINKSDNFPTYNNKKRPVEKRRLSGLEFDKIIKSDFEKGSTIYNTKNYFLFQVFAQGLRVSDLLTLKFSNIKEGRLIFYQFKTKQRHSILINPQMMDVIIDYIQDDGLNHLQDTEFALKLDDETYTGNYKSLLFLYQEKIKKQKENVFQNSDFSVANKWLSAIQEIRFKYYSLAGTFLHNYSKQHSTNFIFPILKNAHFSDLDFNGETKVSLYQYNQLSSKTAIYNKNLKKLQKACEIETNLTSHIARHTYTDLMLVEKTDVYDISKSLGHKNITTTEHYLNDFSVDRVDDANQKTFERFL